MANEKISSLPAAIALTGTELVPIVQGGINVKSTPAAFVSNGSLALSGTNLTYTGTLTGSTGIVNIGSGQVYKDVGGNFGLGVTPSAWSGVGVAFETIGGALLGQGTNNITLYQNTYYATGSYRYKNTNPASMVDQNSGNHRWFNAPSGTANAAITFTQAMTLNTNGNLLVGITSPVSGGGVLQLKSGITFPATQVASSDANTLDDYEEGTWTPAQDASLTVVGTFSSSGTYTKIGRQVTVTALLNGSTSIAASPGKIIATGSLPFATATGGGGTATNASANSMCGVYCSNTAVYSGSSISATSQIGFTATYFV